MKKTILVALTLSITVPALASSEKVCKDRVAEAIANVNQVQQAYNEGQATAIELVDAKLARTEQLFDCTPYVKYNYCRYRITLMNHKLNLQLRDSEGQTTPAVTATEDALKKTTDYCTHPNAKWEITN